MIHHPTWQTLHPAPYELGESPFWHPQEHMLYWVDIPGKKVLRSQADGSALQAWDMTIGLRVSEEDEREGLDITSHGETAYNR